MNYIWCGIVLLAVCFSLFSGHIEDVGNAVFTSAQDAATLAFQMLGILCFWNGLMQIAKDARLTEKIAKALSPLLDRLFPGIRLDSDAKSAISMNITANLMGLGNAATPLGIAAMRELKKQDPHSVTASNDMIRFVVLNTACIRLIPTTVAMLRHEAGSEAPMEILPATILASLLSCAAGLLVARLLEGKRNA